MEMYQNPIQKHGDFADPFVLRFNGKYYLYCTNPGVRCWTSENLIQWSYAGEVVPKDEFPGLVPFAPEVVYDNGWFYMYTSPHGFGHYVLRSESPLGPFKKITPNIGHAIDFSVFIDDDGRWYAYWADNNGILGCLMNSPTEFGEPHYIGAYLHGWTEGPFVVKRDGKYHLTYTGNHFLSKGYRINGASGDSPLGPFTDYDHNPIAVNTTGSVVGLGHSSTVVGPDLVSDWMFYHNLNPDKTRDLNLDRVLFRKADSFLLGPTTYRQQAPQMPDYHDPFLYEAGDEWSYKNGTWKAEEGLRISNGPIFAECHYSLPQRGVLEAHFQASKETTVYGISLHGNKSQRICINRNENCIQLMDENNQLLSEHSLPCNFRHESLHELKLVWGNKTEVYLDHILLSDFDVLPGGQYFAYFSDGIAGFGSVTFSVYHDDLYVPVAALAPAKSHLTLSVDRNGTYLCSLYGQETEKAVISIDGKVMEICNHTANIATFTSKLSEGAHLVSAECGDGDRIRFDRVELDAAEKITASLEEWDKQTGSICFSDLEIKSTLNIQNNNENGQGGIIFRAKDLADGGEGNDKKLGTNFFIGYRVAICDGKIQLWKHLYNETLLAQNNIMSAETYPLTVRCIADEITVYVNDTAVLTYTDSIPISTGFVGFHCRTCQISGSVLSANSIKV